MFATIDWKTKCLRDISPNVNTPEVGYVVVTEMSFRFPYKVGTENKTLIVAGDERAPFLKKHGLIESYAFVGNEVKMFTKSIFSTELSKGQFAMYERLTPFYFSDVVITRERAHSIAVINEFEIAHKTMNNVGYQLNKVFNFFNSAA